MTTLSQLPGTSAQAIADAVCKGRVACNAWISWFQQAFLQKHSSIVAWEQLFAWTIGFMLLVLLLALAYLATVSARWIFRCLLAGQSRDFVAVASSAAGELRKHGPVMNNPHTFHKLRASSMTCACTVCYMPVSRDGQFCELCGAIAHHSCSRIMHHNCKLLVMPANAPPAHDWRPVGCTWHASEPSFLDDLAAATFDGDGDGAGDVLTQSQCCIYCKEPCEVGLIAVEPVWTCSWCRCLAHVQCYVSRHPSLFSDATKKRLQIQVDAMEDSQHTTSAGKRAAVLSTRAKTSASATNLRSSYSTTAAGGQSTYAQSTQQPQIQQNGVEGSKRRRAKSSDGREASDTVEASASGSQRVTRRTAGGGPVATLKEKAKLRKPGSFDGLSSLAGSQESKGENQGVNGFAAQESKQPNGTTHRLSNTGIVALDADVCRFGPVSQLVIPPTCIHQRGRTRQHSPSNSHDGGGNGGSKNHGTSSQLQRGLAVAAAAVKWRRKARLSNSGSASHTNGSRDKNAMSHALAPAPAPQRSKDPWWKRSTNNPHRWSGYSIKTGSLPLGCRPLLVLVNLNSGPQLGRTLYLQLLQLLHPLQVVELPREDPLIALRWFADVPHLRVLVMGGDGTVGWVLQALDTVAAEQDITWNPPPVAVLPMGTGNDLSRCLGWGASAGARLARGLVACLLEVAGTASAAHPVPLDRWNVAITKQVAAQPHAQGIKHLLSSRRLRRIGIGSGGQDEPQSQSKVLNNYLGIGIDAKVALQFHEARSAHPYLFQSQLGNKVWYTGLGAPDLLHRSCAQLYKKLSLTCNGVAVPVPEDAQGLVVINVGCHMGGVYLWETGLPAPPIIVDDEADDEWRDRAAALTTNKRMAIADGLLEVVAIGGVAHMGRLAVGLARAQRLAQCSEVVITTHTSLPMQIDGEPWLQEPCKLDVNYKSQAIMLRRVGGGPAQRVVAAIHEALDASQQGGVITQAQKAALAKEVGRRLEAVLP